MSCLFFESAAAPTHCSSFFSSDPVPKSVDSLCCLGIAFCPRSCSTLLKDIN